jgi:hypothetical protein
VYEKKHNDALEFSNVQQQGQFPERWVTLSAEKLLPVAASIKVITQSVVQLQRPGGLAANHGCLVIAWD